MTFDQSSLKPLTNALSSTRAKVLQREGRCRRPDCLPEERTWQKRRRLAPFEPCYDFHGTPYWPSWSIKTVFHDQASSILAGRLPTEVLIHIWHFLIDPETPVLYMVMRLGIENPFHIRCCEPGTTDGCHICVDLIGKSWCHSDKTECVSADMDQGPFSLMRSCRKLYSLLCPLFYSEARFHFPGSYRFSTFILRTPAHLIAMITSLHFSDNFLAHSIRDPKYFRRETDEYAKTWAQLCDRIASMQGLKRFRLTLRGDYSRDEDKAWHLRPLRRIRQLDGFVVQSYFDYVVEEGDPFEYRNIGSEGVEFKMSVRTCYMGRGWFGW